MSTTVTEAVLGTPAVDFQLLATDGTTRTLDDVAGATSLGDMRREKCSGLNSRG